MKPILIQLTRKGLEEPITLNLNLLVAFHPVDKQKDSGTHITLSNGNNLVYYVVKEDYISILNRAAILLS